MSTNYHTPSASKVAEMLEMVLGVDAVAKESSAPQTAELDHVAIYFNREDEVAATCSCNLSTAAALGCALSMIPPGGAEVMVEEGALSATANDNFYEMMNICSSLLMNDKSAHLRLVEVTVDASKRVQGEGVTEIAFDVDLGKYGKGALVFNHT